MSSETDSLSMSPLSSTTSTVVVTEIATAQASVTTALITSVVTASATESNPAVVVYTVTATPTSQSTSTQDFDVPHQEGFPTGAAIGFIVGLIAFFSIILGVGFYYWRRWRLRRREANRVQETSAAQGGNGAPQMSTLYG